MIASPSLALRFLPEAQALDGIHYLPIEPAKCVQQSISPGRQRVDQTREVESVIETVRWVVRSRNSERVNTLLLSLRLPSARPPIPGAFRPLRRVGVQSV
jgi:hypothetical protein